MKAKCVTQLVGRSAPLLMMVALAPAGAALVLKDGLGLLAGLFLSVLCSVGIGIRFGSSFATDRTNRASRCVLATAILLIVNLSALFIGCACDNGPRSNEANIIGWTHERRRNAMSTAELEKTAKSIRPRDPQAGLELLDLTTNYNAALAESWWTEIGEANLAALPQGLQTFGGVRFDVRGVIRLCSQVKEDFGRKFPGRVEGIRVDAKCRQLHFLHGNFWKTTNGAEVVRYIVHYADGTTAEVPLVYGRDVGLSACTNRPDVENPGARVAWSCFDARRGHTQRLFLTSWRNVKPEVAIATLDAVSNHRVFVTPVLVAASIEPAD